MAALLIQAAEPGVQCLQPGKRGQGVSDALPGAQIHGQPQQGVAVDRAGRSVHFAAPASKNGSSQSGSR